MFQKPKMKHAIIKYCAKSCKKLVVGNTRLPVKWRSLLLLTMRFLFLTSTHNFTMANIAKFMMTLWMRSGSSNPLPNLHQSSQNMEFKFCYKGLINYYQKRILRVFAMSRAKQTSRENPSAFSVRLISAYCGMYGTTPPKIIASDEAHDRKVVSVYSSAEPSSSPRASSILHVSSVYYFACFTSASSAVEAVT